MRLTGDLLIENKKTFLMLWAIPLLALLTLIVVMGVVSGEYINDYGNSFDVMTFPNLFLMMATFVLMCCIVASRGLSNTSNKEMAIQSLMLPVSEKERYIARLILYVPVYTIAFAIGVVLVELMRFGILSVIYPHSENLRILDLSYIFDDGGTINISFVKWCLVFYFIGVQSFFFLSGAIWPKIGMVFSFVFFVALFLFNIVLASIVFTSGIGTHYDYYPEVHMRDWTYTGVAWFNVALSAIFCVISCGINYVLAYFRC
ncbi:MAG: hypothetical protein K2N16_01530, partial [Muribaculaceae bacterium]|nr:hypothetical protein [Muribaculaceae bacterium]